MLLLPRVSLASLCHGEGCSIWKLALLGLFESQNEKLCRVATQCTWVVICLRNISSTLTFLLRSGLWQRGVWLGRYVVKRVCGVGRSALFEVRWVFGPHNGVQAISNYANDIIR